MNTNLKKDSLNQNERLSSNILPELPISKFDRSFTNKTTFDSGRLVPVMLDEILPGDSIELNISALIRSVVPVAPIMDNAKFTLHAFFVPNRLVWDKWKAFMGESNNAWLDSGVDTIPYLDFTNADGSFLLADDWYKAFGPSSLFAYLGIPIIYGENSYGDNDKQLPTKLNALPIRAYVKIWNDWYRDQNLQDALLLDTSSNNVIYNSILKNKLENSGYGFANSDNDWFMYDSGYWDLGVPYGLNLATVSKFADYFTSALPSPQRGDDTYLIDSIKKFNFNVDYSNYETVSNDNGSLGVTDADVTGSDILSINELRYAISIQHFKELDARGGTRYIEIVKNHFGVESQDLRVQRAQFLGGVSQYIQIHQVNQTTPNDGNITNVNQGLGSAGAQSITYVETQNTIKSSFTEHGFLMVLCSVRPENTYAYGLERLWTKYTKFDYFWPTFDNIGEQPIYQYEIMLNRENMESNAIFGYMPAWSDYRYKINRVSGYFSPKCRNSLVNWTYTTNYGYYTTDIPNQIVLNGDFIQQSQKNIAQTLTYQNMHQFIATFYFDYKHSRVMKVDSIPGIDRI